MRRPLVCLGLTIAALHVGCGTGISTDPEGVNPSANETGDDGGNLKTIDARDADGSTRDDDSAIGPDARHDDSDNDDAGGTPDVAANDANPVDRSADASGDTADDAPSDVSLDAARDASLDVFNDSASDARGDTGRDAAGDVSRDVSDVSDSRQDATLDSALDAAVDAYDGCTVTCWPDADYYVDATAASGGNGSKLQPFKTITAAVQAHGAAPGLAEKAYVAPGTYDESLGESFPLVLRGLSLEGAGQDRTLIVGAGHVDHGPEGGSMANLLTVTVVIGERELPTQLSRLSIRSSSPVPVENYHGVLCDRGNASGEVVTPLGQTHLDQVTVGPGYATDVVIATSTNPISTGCNMLITRSTITAAWRGVLALGCGSGAYDDPVMLEMGTDDPASGNIISWITAADNLGVGLTLQDCLIRGSFQYNTFQDSLVGAELADSGLVSPPHTRVNVSFKHNVFERLGRYGLLANGYTLFADEISDNRFTGVTRAVNQLGAFALSMDVFDVGKIRRNEFVGNDTAIEAHFSASAGTPADFGAVVDSGSNVFRCNSAPEGKGGDVLIAGNAGNPELTWAGTLSFVGNAWDHLPPTLLTVDPPPNGIDISLRYAPHIDIDRQNAALSTVGCPSGRVPGQ